MSASPLITGNGPHSDGRARAFSVHGIEFTGSGGEYFRIWLVNLLLMMVTLGLYYPWAKVRKLRYFHGHTVVAGHPLDFHGNPRQMFRGYMLVAVFMGLYSFAGLLSPLADTVSFIALVLIWPAMMRASLKFRLGNTSWRGMRFHFTGSLKGAYMAMLAPILLVIGLVVLGGVLGAFAAPAAGDDEKAAASSLAALVFLPFMLAGMGLAPYVWWQMKRYQHSNYALGSLQTTFRAGFGSVFGVFFKSSLIGMACLFVALVASMALLIPAIVMMANGADRDEQFKALLALLPVLFLMIMLAQFIQVPYFTSRMQNLVWTETGNRTVRFKSTLAFKPLLWLTLKNGFLTLVTLGLYWPFAAVALARAKVQAVVIHSRQDLDELAAQGRRGHRDATGDLAADVLGLDFGL